ncbi:MAG: hypothetical protein M3246_04295 [Actinomycetota bacterium]|nr:hypothetical protein [Actinomycetota bacterium]
MTQAKSSMARTAVNPFRSDVPEEDLLELPPTHRGDSVAGQEVRAAFRSLR